MYIYLIQKHSDVLLQNNVYKLGTSQSINAILTGETTQNSTIHIIYRVDDSDTEKEFEYIKRRFNERFTHVSKSAVSSFGDGIYKGDIVKMKLAFINAISAYNTKPVSETIDQILHSEEPFESMSTASTEPPYLLTDIDDDLENDMMEYTDGDDMLDYGVEKDIVEETLQQKTNSEADDIMNDIVESIKQQYLKECVSTEIEVDTNSALSTAQTENK